MQMTPDALAINTGRMRLVKAARDREELLASCECFWCRGGEDRGASVCGEGLPRRGRDAAASDYHRPLTLGALLELTVPES